MSTASLAGTDRARGGAIPCARHRAARAEGMPRGAPPRRLSQANRLLGYVPRPHRSHFLAPTLFLLAVVAVLVLSRLAHAFTLLAAYGVCAFSYLLVKLVGSSLYVRAPAEPSPLTVAAVVPVFNEDPVAFAACLRSLLDQTHAVSEIFVVDDGSSSEECHQVAREVLAGVRASVVVHRFDANRGKREAQAWAFRRTRADIVLTVDSDTVLAEDCVAEGLGPFTDVSVQAVTGTVRAANHGKNLLTRLIDVRYVNAFLYERAAYSRMGGSVLCCCGSMSLWRTELLLANLDDFVAQTFLGVRVSYGDDRRLTNYALRAGRVVLQDSAVAYTYVPERMGHFLRQQIRWNKSFFRESLWVVRSFSLSRAAWWLAATELVSWMAFSVNLFSGLVVLPLLGVSRFGWLFLGYVVAMSYARSSRYVLAPGGRAAWREWLTFLLAPAYSLLHIFVLMPLRLYSLATLRDGAWGTRTQIEVTA